MRYNPLIFRLFAIFALLASLAVWAACNVEEPRAYTLTTYAIPPDGGIVSRSLDQIEYGAGTRVTLTAAAREGYTFFGWSGASSSASPSITVPVNGNLTFIANFLHGTPPQDAYTLTASANPASGGTVLVDGAVPAGPMPIDAGTQVTVTAAPRNGYEFSHWTGDAAGTANPITVAMNANKSVTAVFVAISGNGGIGFGAVDPKSVVKGEIADPRDGKRYKTVKIGTLTWTAENLNFATDSSWCYDDDNSNCATYGRLYNWDAAKSACLGLGGGWHLPDNAEWDRLVADVSGVFDVTLKDTKGNVVRTVEGYNFAGKNLKSKSGWKSFYVDDYDGDTSYAYGPVFVKDGNGYSVTVERVKEDYCYGDDDDDCYYYNFIDSVLVTGTDDFGFSALPGGYRHSGGSFYSAGRYGHWWSATEGGSDYAYYRVMYYNGDLVHEDGYYRSNGFSARCVAVAQD